MGRCKYFFLIFFILSSTMIAGEFNSNLVGGKKDQKKSENNKSAKKKKMDKWIAPDKAKHFLAGAFSTIFIYKTCEDVKEMNKKKSKNYAISLTAIISIGKEVIDSRSVENHFCWKDLLFDGMGILTGLAIVNQR